MVSSSMSEHLSRYMYSIIVTFLFSDATLFLLALTSHKQALTKYLYMLFPTSLGLMVKQGMKYCTSKRMATPLNVFSH